MRFFNGELFSKIEAQSKVGKYIGVHTSCKGLEHGAIGIVKSYTSPNRGLGFYVIVEWDNGKRLCLSKTVYLHNCAEFIDDAREEG